jgi:Kef-type K+ transport system membrane component KefB
MRWFLFLVVAGVSWTARQIGFGVVVAPAGSALLSVSVLLIGGVLAGEAAARLRLPRITGYLVIGMAVGPHALGLETAADARFLHLFEDLALGLIALTAGGELRLAGLRRRARPLAMITTSHAVGILLVVTGAMALILTLRPFLGDLTGAQVLAAAALLGVIAVAVSPATTIAVITELEARGELTETVLGVTILKDLVILLLFTGVSGAVVAWSTSTPMDVTAVRAAAGEIGVSLVVGAVLGLVFGAYLGKVERHHQLVVVVLSLVSAELGRAGGVEHLLVCMAAGFMIRNGFPHASARFLDALEQSSSPIYVLFFALVGAGLNLGVFLAVWLPAVIFVAVRLGAVYWLTRLPAKLAGSSPEVVRYAWMGFVAQAGLSIGLASRIQRDIPDFGAAVATLVVAAVVVNQLLGPILWERALRASGEARAAP